MKILMLGWELPPYNSGGLGVACYQLARALAGRGAQIQFVLPAGARHNNPDFMEVVQPAETATIAKYSSVHNPYAASLSEVAQLQSAFEAYVETIVSRERPAVIHANDWLTLGAGIKAKKLSGAPLIAHVHATEFDRAGGGSGNPLIHEVEQQGLLMADHIVAVSDATRRLIAREYHVPIEKIEVIHNSSEPLPEHATDMSEYRYIEALKREGYVVVATIGRLTIQKGLTYFLQAASKAHKRYERFVFLVTGDGEQRDELITLSADLGIADAVLFTGFVRGKQWRDVYNLADIFVMSSVSEPFGLTALEAAQHDTAVILTQQSGVSEVLHSVLNYDYWDTDRLADQLIGLALSPALQNELAQNAAREFSHMSWLRVADRFLSRYHVLEAAA